MKRKKSDWEISSSGLPIPKASEYSREAYERREKAKKLEKIAKERNDMIDAGVPPEAANKETIRKVNELKQK